MFMLRQSTTTARTLIVIGLASGLLLAACAGGAGDTAEPATSTPTPVVPPPSEAATESVAATMAEGEATALVAESDLGHPDRYRRHDNLLVRERLGRHEHLRGRLPGELAAGPRRGDADRR